MGINILKWVYDLGVNNERNRIAAYLDRTALQVRADYTDDLDCLRGEDNMSKRNMVSLEKSIELQQQVERIIRGLFKSEHTYVTGESIMFPKGKK